MTLLGSTFTLEDLKVAASALCRLLAEVDSEGDEALVASRPVRHRLEGALLVLDLIASGVGVAPGNEAPESSEHKNNS